MNAVILCGSPGTALLPLANDRPKTLLPIANEPLLRYALEALRECEIAEVAIVGPAQSDRDREMIERLSGAESDFKVSYLEEAQSSGTAGALRGLRAFSDSDFVVLGANIFCTGSELKTILAFHRSRGNSATMVVERVRREAADLENVELDGDDGSVRSVHLLHHSSDRRRPLRSSGIYVFAPRVLDSIPLQGYMDLREQLIPALRRDDIRLDAYLSPRPVRKIDTVSDYFQLNREIVAASASYCHDPASELLDGVWVGKDVELSPRAHLIGPIRIADDCVIADHVQIVGPTSIGAGTRIDECAFVRESAIFPGVHLMPCARVEYSVVAEGALVAENASLTRAIVVNRGDDPRHQKARAARRREGSESESTQPAPGGSDTPASWPLCTRDGLRDKSPDSNPDLSPDLDPDLGPTRYITPFTESPWRRSSHQMYLVTKRTLDIVASCIGLLALLPLLPVIALAIRLDSRGPTLFRQRRCGKHGREFTMYKFRTMEQGAEQSQNELAEFKNVDGPMFKIRDDPRVTRVGRALRRSGLDELPQLLNVLRAEMSLVGPRPLAMEEMQFAPSWRDIRLQVTPGITGLWQISDRSEVSFHNWIASDISYVRQQSLLLDLAVLWKTLLFSVRGSGS